MDIKKAWNLTVAIPRLEALALPYHDRIATQSPRRHKLSQNPLLALWYTHTRRTFTVALSVRDI